MKLNHFVERVTRSRFGLSRLQRHLQSRRERSAYRQRLLLRTPNEPFFKNARELTLISKHDVFLNDLEVPLLSKYASNSSADIVEIGCAFGASTILLLAHCRPGTLVHSIDPFVVDSMAPFQATASRCRSTVLGALSAIGQSTKHMQWRLIEDFSYNVTAGWTGAVDLLFIDGDHRYEAVRQDFYDWFRHVKVGGHILFHDSRKLPGTAADTFDRGWIGPTQFVEELQRERFVDLVETAYSITVFRKTTEATSR
jgi:predicted O-methyltransferase YrrM